MVKLFGKLGIKVWVELLAENKALHVCKARASLEVVKRKKQRLISLKTRKLLIIASVSKDNTLMRRRGVITIDIVTIHLMKTVLRQRSR